MVELHDAVEGRSNFELLESLAVQACWRVSHASSSRVSWLRWTFRGNGMNASCASHVEAAL